MIVGVSDCDSVVSHCDSGVSDCDTVDGCE